jgi:hypothetical protein
VQTNWDAGLHPFPEQPKQQAAASNGCMHQLEQFSLIFDQFWATWPEKLSLELSSREQANFSPFENVKL